MRFVVILFLFLLPGVANAQFDRTQATMPPIDAFSPRYVDFHWKNSTGKKTYLLRVKQGLAISALSSGKEVLPDSTLTLRFQYNPQSKGIFDETIDVYLAHLMEPITLRIRGNVVEMPAELSMECPGFDHDQHAADRELLVIVRDSATSQPLRNATVRVAQAGRIILTGSTNGKGELVTKVPAGYLYMEASAAGYYTRDFVGYIPSSMRQMVFLLPAPQSIRENPEPEIIPTDTLEPVLAQDTSSFSLRDFRPNNIVFLLDISSSMGSKGRIEMLKAGMVELMAMLRPQDKVTLVTYATRAEVLLPATTGDQKQTLDNAIVGLNAFGITAGGDGIKLAYEEAKNNFIPDGNNVVIMVTDGVFNTGEKKYMKFVRKNARKGISMSLVAVKTNEVALESLGIVASVGKGRMLHIQTLPDASKLLKQEIKTGSFIGR
jgi:Ca-activated chloride channel family protein